MLGTSLIPHGRPVPACLIGLCLLCGYGPIEGRQLLVEGTTTLVQPPRQARSDLGVAPVHLPVLGVHAEPILVTATLHVRSRQTALLTYLSTCVLGGHAPLSLWLPAHVSTCQPQTEDSNGNDCVVGALAHRRDCSHHCLVVPGHHATQALLARALGKG